MMTKQYILGKSTCEFCNKDDFTDRATTTTDGKRICLYCIEQPRLYHCKGLLSSEEVKEYNKVEKERQKTAVKLLTTFNKHCQFNKIKDKTAELKILFQSIDEFSVGIYQKAFNCLREEEKTVAMKKFVLMLGTEEVLKETLTGESDGWFRKKFGEIFY